MKLLLALCIPVVVLLGGCAGGAPYEGGQSDLYFGASNDVRPPIWMNREVGMPATRIR